VHLCVKGGDAAIAFYEKAFGASCTFKKMAEDGKRVLHANIAMFGGEVMLHDEFPEYHGNVPSPISRGGASIVTHINLSEPSGVDNAVSRAEAAGAAVILKPDDMFWGARYGQVRDPFGHVWAFNAPKRAS
jgi:PhnB protein